MAASDAGEEAAWTKINGSSVHAHTDTYLCIVARNHSWIHINCVARFYITAENPYETVAWAAGYRFAYSVTRGSKVLQPKTAGLIRYKFLPIILFYFIFFPKCHEYTNMTTHGVQCTRNETWRWTLVSTICFRYNWLTTNVLCKKDVLYLCDFNETVTSGRYSKKKKENHDCSKCSTVAQRNFSCFISGIPNIKRYIVFALLYYDIYEQEG